MSHLLPVKIKSRFNLRTRFYLLLSIKTDVFQALRSGSESNTNRSFDWLILIARGCLGVVYKLCHARGGGEGGFLRFFWHSVTGGRAGSHSHVMSGFIKKIKMRDVTDQGMVFPSLCDTSVTRDSLKRPIFAWNNLWTTPQPCPIELSENKFFFAVETNHSQEYKKYMRESSHPVQNESIFYIFTIIVYDTLVWTHEKYIIIPLWGMLFS